ncbi:MAG: peptide ABC transporter permease [Anaerolineales bacterium]|nr:ABC transporter permease [Anaerolineae bacterium]PWB71336.1 MAG: peptide ABC transporter permease [Anaerolineales bacterium]
MRHIEFILRRLVTSIFVLLGVSVITFFIARVVPTDAAAQYIGPKARPEEIERVRIKLGLDKPLPVQYAIYMGELLHGDLGNSISTKRPITQELADRIPATMELLLVGMFIAVLLGVPIGVLSARWSGKLPDLFIRLVSIIGVSMPAFFLGLLLQIIFFRNLDLLPLAGRLDSDMRFVSPVTDITGFILLDSLLTQNWVALKDAFLHIILPAFTLAAYPIGLIARMTRAAMLEVLEQDYIRTARAYGIKDRIVIYLYALKNAISPTLTVIGLTFAFALTGTFFVEIIFNWPGLGLFTTRSLLNLDYPAIMGMTLLGATGYVLINLIVDVIQSWIDPRVSLH